MPTHPSPSALDPVRDSAPFGAVLLAAGSASRMGHRPKALLQLNGVPLLRRQLQALAGAGMPPPVLVLGHHAERITPLLREGDATVVHNPQPDAGQVSSLRLGLAALQQPVQAVIVALVDQALIGPIEILDLIAAWRQRPLGTELLQPTVDGLPGNPVVFSAAVRQAILAADADTGGRQWQAAHPDRVFRWATPNTVYRADVDTPEDIEALAQRTGQRLVWPPGV